MHDIKAIREAPAAFDAALDSRGLPPMSSRILALDEERRSLIYKAESLQAEQNAAAREIGQAKARGRRRHLPAPPRRGRRAARTRASA